MQMLTCKYIQSTYSLHVNNKQRGWSIELLRLAIGTSLSSWVESCKTQVVIVIYIYYIASKIIYFVFLQYMFKQLDFIGH